MTIYPVVPMLDVSMWVNDDTTHDARPLPHGGRAMIRLHNDDQHVAIYGERDTLRRFLSEFIEQLDAAIDAERAEVLNQMDAEDEAYEMMQDPASAHESDGPDVRGYTPEDEVYNPATVKVGDIIGADGIRRVIAVHNDGELIEAVADEHEHEPDGPPDLSWSRPKPAGWEP